MRVSMKRALRRWCMAGGLALLSTWQAPAWAGCDAAAAQAAGLDGARLCAWVASGLPEVPRLHSLLIVHQGQTLAELYQDGPDQTVPALWSHQRHFDADTLHDVRSISKSIVSLLWGIAQAQGLVPPLDTPALSLLPELADLKGQGREAITLSHLMDMASGLDWTEPGWLGPLGDDEFSLYWRASQARFLFNRPLATPPGQHFNYNGGGTALLAQLLADRVGMPLPAWADRVLMQPLGITTWEWRSDFRDRPLAFAGIRLRPRDLARIGQMVLDGGRWQGWQIVPAVWVAESMTPRVDVMPGIRYGRQWWAGQAPDAQGRAHAWTAGFGNGGQRLFMVPDLGLVVVVTAGHYGDGAMAPVVTRLIRSVVVTALPRTAL